MVASSIALSPAAASSAAARSSAVQPDQSGRVGSAAEVRKCFQTALENVKPTDALIVGMYQQFGDQVGEDAALVRELCGGTR